MINDTKDTAIDLDLLDNKQILKQRKLLNDHINFWVKFTCKKCKKIVYKNISRKSKCTIKYITLCTSCIRKDTFLKKYGVDSYTKTKEYIEKTKATNKKKYGTEWGLQSDIIKEKSKQTIRVKYNVDNISQLNDIKTKKKQTCNKNYGVDNPSKSKEVQKNTRK